MFYFQSIHKLNVLLFTIALMQASSVLALPNDESSSLAGSIAVMHDGKVVTLAALRNHYRVKVSGDIVEVELKQTFSNPFDKPLNARYLFPLNRNAAVHAMSMTIGQEVIEAQIQQTQQAQQTFAKAKRAGKAAALLEQHRPNMFTQNVANLMPNQPIEVTIRYTHIVPKVDGDYELVVPMVVGPRFNPAGAGERPSQASNHARHDSEAETTPTSVGKWVLEALPAYPPTAGINLPNTLEDRVTLDLTLETPLPLTSSRSDTHPLAVRDVSSTMQTMSFAAGKVLDNKDFVLRYNMSGDTAQAGLLSHWQRQEGGYFSLLIEPPTTVAPTDTLAREMVFLLDCSGSMSGAPMDASKLFMTHALKALRPQDSFRIIRFSDAATEFSRAPLPATAQNIALGLQYTQLLYGSGGTMMTSGIQQALNSPVPEGLVRNVVFLTDGYIGNEASVLGLVERLRGEARLFAFGVGAGVNRYLLDELGRVGRGFTRYFDPTREAEDMSTIAADLARRLQTPVLRDLEIDWGTLEVSEVHPEVLPDLYAGDSLRVTGRFRQAQGGHITIAGRTVRAAARLNRAVALSDSEQRPALASIWARTRVADLMHQFITPDDLRRKKISREDIQTQVTQLGLQHKLLTRWTAFVAVSKRIYNPDADNAVDADVALPQVAGVSKLAYSQPAMTGFGAPEPGIFLGLIAVFVTLFGLRRRLYQS